MSKNKSTKPIEFEKLKPFIGLEVTVINNNIEEAIKRFKSKVQKSQILSEYKESQVYEKPSDKKRRKIREYIERIKIEQLREKQILNGEWEKKQKKKEARKKAKLLKKMEEAKKRESDAETLL